jgi:hypothetical protein
MPTDHTHHFVPRPAGRTAQGEPVRELVCECGAAPRCPKCGGANGQHGFVHTRYGNGGGGNRMCPDAPKVDASRIGHRGMR